MIIATTVRPSVTDNPFRIESAVNHSRHDRPAEVLVPGDDPGEVRRHGQHEDPEEPAAPLDRPMRVGHIPKFDGRTDGVLGHVR